MGEMMRVSCALLLAFFCMARLALAPCRKGCTKMTEGSPYTTYVCGWEASNQNDCVQNSPPQTATVRDCISTTQCTDCSFGNCITCQTNCIRCFANGHSACPAPRDTDGDGYYNCADVADFVDGTCDCNDTNANINPSAYEGDLGGNDCSLCNDSQDNDCDGYRDLQDSDCGPCLGSPIVIDTQGNGFALVGLEAGVQFDIFGDGKPILLGWVQGDDALLVLDRNGNGLIDSGLELFGNHTRLQSGRRAENGYQALAEFDVNGDSVIDERDPVFSGLRLWLDRNVNGVTDAGQLTTLADHGISGPDLSYRESRRRDQYGNEFRYRAKVYGSRQTTNRFCYDVIFVGRTMAK